MKETEEKMKKKAFRLKQLRLCKTKTKKSSPDMFNFYVVLAGNDKVTDAGRATTCRRKFKAPCLQTKLQKLKDLSKTWVLTGKRFEDFGRKKDQNHYSRPFRKPNGTQEPQSHQLNMARVNSKN